MEPDLDRRVGNDKEQVEERVEGSACDSRIRPHTTVHMPNTHQAIIVESTSDSVLSKPGKGEGEIAEQLPMGPKAYYRQGPGNHRGNFQNIRQHTLHHHHKDRASPESFGSQYRSTLPEDDRKAYDGVSSALDLFNDDMQVQVNKAQELDSYRIKHTRIGSYFVSHDTAKPQSMLHQLDLRTNQQKRVPAAKIANAQAKIITEQTEQIKSLHEKLRRLEKDISKRDIELAELRIKIFIQETKIAKLDVELAERDREVETVRTNGDAENGSGSEERSVFWSALH